MKNLEQIRAAHASPASGRLDRGAVTKLPALIINNGFLATLAFTLESSSRKEMLKAMLKLAEYLRQQGLLTHPAHGKNDEELAREVIDELVDGSSAQLQRVTAEALAYLAYLKRFTPKKA
jgi:CRISPR-associated protein Cmr5